MRMWKCWNPCALLAGMENGAAAVENRMAVPQTIETELPCEPAIPLLGIINTSSMPLIQWQQESPVWGVVKGETLFK